MKRAIQVSLCLGLVAACGADIIPKARSATFKDDDYSTGVSSSGTYPESQPEARYPVAADETASGGDQESHPYAQTQTLENPAYDPNMYQNFLPQDSVQQYVTQYAGHPYSQMAGPNGGDPYALAGPTAYAMGPGGPGPYGPIPYGPAFGPGGPGFAPGGPGFGPGGPGFAPGPGAFAVQSGYEGFLVPSVLPPPPPPPVFSIIRSMLPRSLMSMFMRSGDYIFRTLSFLFFGGVFTTALCSLTPLCSITFPFLGFLRIPGASNLLQKTFATEITSDRVARAAEFVGTALVKYQKLQAEMEQEDKKNQETSAGASEPVPESTETTVTNN